MSGIQTEITPPEVGEDGGGESLSMRISASIIDVDEISYDAGVQIFDEDCQNPDMVATALVRIVMALGMLYGPDVSWAVQQRITPEPEGGDAETHPGGAHAAIVAELDRLRTLGDALAAEAWHVAMRSHRPELTDAVTAWRATR